MIPIGQIEKLKRAYHLSWRPSDHKYMCLEPQTGAVVFSNNLDCDGKLYFCRHSFARVIKGMEQALLQESDQ